MMTADTLPPSWQALGPEFAAPYMRALDAFLEAERAAGARVFPDEADRFRALELTPLDQVRVVILGQDPYHGEGQAHGLSFSVRQGVRTPPSLVNIYKELEADLGIPRARHGMLDHWAAQGVLLLNAVLSVRMGEAASHSKRGWERFTDAVIATVNAQDKPVVFLLWGAYAQKKAAFVDDLAKGGRHLVIQSAHPSPLAARTGFFGSRPFSRANAFLETHGRTPINWALPEMTDE
ncbi:MAG TPA: uracil-DNA glycosylase [Sphingomonas sp.]|nr:uracil-DNA glycosylase [Sphingomonas sp.]